MELIKGKNWCWDFLKKLFKDVRTVLRGHIILGYGKHELEIEIDENIVPLEVYFNCFDQDQPVCQGNISTVSGRLGDDNSFILYADIQSNSCLVEWLIEYEPIE